MNIFETRIINLFEEYTNWNMELFFKLLKARKHPKKFLAIKGMKIQEKIWMKMQNVTHGL